jgi:hypothetical protein
VPSALPVSGLTGRFVTIGILPPCAACIDARGTK